MYVPEYSIPWWFEYFWAEAKMSAKADEKQQLADIANTIFVKTPDERFKYKAKPESSTSPIAASSSSPGARS